MVAIDVARDTWGIAHVTAPDRRSAYAAQGWVAAADRIWQMEWDRRRALGRWAEVAGGSAVREDAFFRRIGIADAARRDWEALGDAAKSMTTAYAEGVNLWLAEHQSDLPPEFAFHPAPPERWEPWHCVAVYKVRHVFMGTLYRKLWRGAVTLVAGPDAAFVMRGEPEAAAPIVAAGTGPPISLLADGQRVLNAAVQDLQAIPDVDGGSNNWAVHGSRTASGLPLLAGDPHRGIEFPNVYHQCHLTCPDFDVIGLGFPGVPGFPHFGHNDSVAWCITHGMADDTDVFIEPVGSVTDRRTETIDVYGAESVDVEIGSTASGPVVLGDLGAADGVVLAAMWTGIWNSDTTLDCLEPMLLADGCDGLEAGVTDWVVPVNNLLTADVTGNISYRIRGSVVERPVANRWTPVAGSPESRWTGLTPVPDSELQRWRNPDRGYLVTANNRISDSGPYISLDFAGPARHDRIVQRLDTLTDATVDDMTDIHRDVYSSVASRLGAILTRLEPATPLGVEALELIRTWDHLVTVDSSAAVIYATTRRMWVEHVGDVMGLSSPEVGERGWPRAADVTRMLSDAATMMLLNDTWTLVDGLDTESDLLGLLARLFDAAAAAIAEEFGPDPATWRWGTVHTMLSPHPLAVARPEAEPLHPPMDGCPGDGDTVRAGSLTPATGERSAAGSVARYVFDLSDWSKCGWVVPHGVSGVRGGGHDLDQRAAWLASELIPMAYGDVVASVTVDRFTIEL